MQFSNPASTKMKTKNVTTLHLRKSSDRSPSRLAFLLIPLLLVCFALSPAPNAFGVSPPLDGGYPGGDTAEGEVSGDTAEGAVYLLLEGFNNVNNLPGWFRRNNSQPLGNTNWFQGDPDTFEAFAGAANSYIAADDGNVLFRGADQQLVGDAGHAAAEWGYI